jgi:hypothetical protein
MKLLVDRSKYTTICMETIDAYTQTHGPFFIWTFLAWNGAVMWISSILNTVRVGVGVLQGC